MEDALMNTLSSITWLLLALATIAAGTGLLMWCADVLHQAQATEYRNEG
jgi:hypothetical protein